MQKVIDFLSANTTVFLATSDSGAARVRPFQFQFAENGRLWFCTARSKETFAQMQNDPRLEFACMSPKMETLRVKGQANLDDDMVISSASSPARAFIRSRYTMPSLRLLASL